MALRDKLKVLVVDDMTVSRGLLTQALDEIGVHGYTTEKDGAAALKSLSMAPRHLVISDYEMPNMNGLQLLAKIRENAATKGVGFILITGRASPSILGEGRRLGMNNYHEKPFTVASLRACIEKVVGPL